MAIATNERKATIASDYIQLGPGNGPPFTRRSLGLLAIFESFVGQAGNRNTYMWLRAMLGGDA